MQSSFRPRSLRYWFCFGSTTLNGNRSIIRTLLILEISFFFKKEVRLYWQKHHKKHYQITFLLTILTAEFLHAEGEWVDPIPI